jgi:hypothetical protein
MLARIDSLVRRLSLDTWAVVAAFLAALLIRVGVLKHISW